MNIRASVRKALRRLLGRGRSPDERKARRAAKHGGGRDKAKRRTTGGSPPS